MWGERSLVLCMWTSKTWHHQRFHTRCTQLKKIYYTCKFILPARWLFKIPADWGSFLLSVFLPNWEGRRKGGGEGLVIAITITVLLTSPKSFNISFKLQDKLSEIFPFWGWIISAFMFSPAVILTTWVGREREIVPKMQLPDLHLFPVNIKYLHLKVLETRYL